MDSAATADELFARFDESDFAQCETAAELSRISIESMERKPRG